jgi:hypothetical protein
MIYAAQIYMLIVCLNLGYRDGINYRIFGKPVGRYTNVKAWLKTWHAQGAGDYLMHAAAVTWVAGWQLIVAALLIRVATFDVAYNKGARMPLGHIGTEAFWDRFFSAKFGKDGALLKMLFAIIIIIALNILHSLT